MNVMQKISNKSENYKYLIVNNNEQLSYEMFDSLAEANDALHIRYNNLADFSIVEIYTLTYIKPVMHE